MFCMKCGNQMSADAKFCNKCGAQQDNVVISAALKQSETVSKTVSAMCPNCKTVMTVNPAFKFVNCGKCGANSSAQAAIKAFAASKTNPASGFPSSSGFPAASSFKSSPVAQNQKLFNEIAHMLGTGNFTGTKMRCDQILRNDPTEAKAYLYKLLAELRCAKRTDLAYLNASFENNPNFIKAMEYGDDALRGELQGYVDIVNKKLSNNRNAGAAREQAAIQAAVQAKEAEEQAAGKAAELAAVQAAKEAEEQAVRKAAEPAVAQAAKETEEKTTDEAFEPVSECEEDLSVEEPCVDNAFDEQADSSTKPVVFKELHKGEELRLGTTGGETISWTVLDVKDGSALVISNKPVCTMAYHLPGGDITWRDCEVRKWLNGEFLETCFKADESAAILTCSNVVNENNPTYNTPGGEPTSDKLFLLSMSEANEYFPDNESRALGSYWWLRTPGSNPANAAVVGSDGRISSCGSLVVNYFGKYGVRPAMWIALDA